MAAESALMIILKYFGNSFCKMMKRLMAFGYHEMGLCILFLAGICHKSRESK